mmetsp:Transcript_35189/g.69409  ORF Transcript_35189/g.69409 Transcript_35189/m.69409 type:complete len:244 (+) Transcript_35189:2172-2903(+)
MPSPPPPMSQQVTPRSASPPSSALSILFLFVSRTINQFSVAETPLLHTQIPPSNRRANHSVRKVAWKSSIPAMQISPFPSGQTDQTHTANIASTFSDRTGETHVQARYEPFDSTRHTIKKNSLHTEIQPKDRKGPLLFRGLLPADLGHPENDHMNFHLVSVCGMVGQIRYGLGLVSEWPFELLNEFFLQHLSDVLCPHLCVKLVVSYRQNDETLSFDNSGELPEEAPPAVNVSGSSNHRHQVK